MVLDSRIDGGVAVLTLNRPDVLNAFNDELGMALLDAVAAAAKDDGVRCIVITGAGRAFSSGEDLGALADGYKAGNAPELGRTLTDRYNPLIRAIRAAPKPVIAAINGVAAGAGASLALACDWRIAVEGSRLVLAFVKVGLVPDSGAIWLLSRMVGSSRAWQLGASGDPLSVDDARELGIVHRVESRDDFETAWRNWAAELAAGPTRAFALTKQLVNAAAGDLDGQLEREAEAQAAAGRTADHLEGVRAFFDKRPPRFEGK